MSFARLLLGALLLGSGVYGQTTQGLILGRVYDASTGRSIANAVISAYHAATQQRAAAPAGTGGHYAIGSLAPGIYSVRATAEGYQARETNLIELPVAGRTELDFPLRLLTSDPDQGVYSSAFVPGNSPYVHTYTADIQATRVDLLNVLAGAPGILESTLSYVVSPAEVERLPLAGRDLYSTLALQPGVTSYLGTARGLGLTVNGQRPSATNFLLDGVENNNHLTTGPLTTVTPEAMLEYRISTTNYSAEYGRTSGVIANAVSRSGAEGWHALLYTYLRNDKLNANGWQQNATRIDRAPLHELETGGSTSARLWRNLFGSMSFDWLRYRSRNDPVQWTLPTREWIASTPTNTDAGRLLRQYALPIAPSAPGQSSAIVPIAPAVTIDRYSGVPRLDYVTGGEGRTHLTARLAVSQLRQPDLFFSPYRDFSAPFRQGAENFAGAATTLPRASMANEFRFSFSGDSTRLDRVHSEVPFFENGEGVTLPGSPAAFTFHNDGRDVEVLDNFSILAGRSVWKFGGGVLHRGIDSLQTVLSAGQFTFDDLARFAADEPKSLLLTYDRAPGAGISKPPFSASYAYNQWSLFAQHSWKASRRLFVNYGFRYEYFGAPHSAADTYEIVLGQGTTLRRRISKADWSFVKGDLYSSEPGNAALRAGWAYDLSGSGNTLLKGSYGWFYDRPFDNVWQGIQTDRLQFGFSNFANLQNGVHVPVPLVGSPYNTAAGTPPASFEDVLDPLLYQPHIRNPMAQNFFLGVQQRLPGAAVLEVAYIGSLVTRLLTTDKVNRLFTMAGDDGLPNPDPGVNRSLQLNAALPVLSYRANQGKSNYHALTATVRINAHRLRGQVAYTWSHSIDLQSDPLAAEFLNFNFFNEQRAGSTRIASFTRQFDSQTDRASSDFDQRHNLVFYGVADLPSVLGRTRAAPLFRNWQAGFMGALRSGFPYTVFARSVEYSIDGVERIYNNPADLLNPAAARIDVANPQAGGRTLLNATAFGTPAFGQTGTSGRNGFRGPGLAGLDVSLSRSFRAPRWERGRFTLRADAFNVMNHVNLNNPANTTLHTSGFGVALYGRSEEGSGFPLQTPLSDTARSVQVLLRLQF